MPSIEPPAPFNRMIPLAMCSVSVQELIEINEALVSKNAVSHKPK